LDLGGSQSLDDHHWGSTVRAEPGIARWMIRGCFGLGWRWYCAQCCEAKGQQRGTPPIGEEAQVANADGERQVASSANAAKPEIDLYVSYESRGVVIPGLTAIGGDSLTGNAPTDPIPTGGIRSSTLYEAGIQFALPLQNRVAKANLGADKALLRQQQLRVMQLESQVSAEVSERDHGTQRREDCRRCRYQGARVAVKAARRGPGKLHRRLYDKPLRDRTADLSGAVTDH
jgi:hypothetical protein